TLSITSRGAFSIGLQYLSLAASLRSAPFITSSNFSITPFPNFFWLVLHAKRASMLPAYRATQPVGPRKRPRPTALPDRQQIRSGAGLLNRPQQLDDVFHVEPAG